MYTVWIRTAGKRYESISFADLDLIRRVWDMLQHEAAIEWTSARP